ncbi:hypothetical protein KM043_013029 [Ampulex compressa]|nr:hypothetical protein KM043_013029 [Ampulex compressa]
MSVIRETEIAPDDCPLAAQADRRSERNVPVFMHMGLIAHDDRFSHGVRRGEEQIRGGRGGRAADEKVRPERVISPRWIGRLGEPSARGLTDLCAQGPVALTLLKWE